MGHEQLGQIDVNIAHLCDTGTVFLRKGNKAGQERLGLDETA